ncbi:hypothetical protein AZE42_04077 [Rhizopogon vesiculosus]|uniref:Uncharacterized protein n=1 Tax=Rhizopogon vesiculosus TaxID=180088 RepID=A0A1J8QF85_9AGAM|nr:hypothetical protein AZE42_04077 [Rhizopogon vesiculosus]
MRLLHTKDLCWIETPKSVQPYAILSHRWLVDPNEEVSFQDLQRRQVPPSEGSHSHHAVCDIIQLQAALTDYFKEHTFHPDVRRKEGFIKLKGACDRAFQDGLNYIWVDTCCIDKNSSAELSEAINSMYAWYKDSAVCYVYLHDVDHNIPPDLTSALKGADWFKRGWTLQELLAPDNVYFFAKDWSRIGTKATWAFPLHEITRIRKEILLGIPCSPSIAERMSWAVGRKTQKIEDRAYSLMGIFGVHMPIIYGEGEKAFRRLQLEIIKSSNDQTIFAWYDSLEYPNPSRQRGLLASAPDVFLWKSPHPLVNIDHSSFLRCLPQTVGCRNRSGDQLNLEQGFAIQNDGIHITLPMKQKGGSWLAVLKCKREDQELPYGIYLHEISTPNIFLRTAPTKLQPLERGDLDGLVLRDIRMVVDYHAPPTTPRRQLFTLRSTDSILDRCDYSICPDPKVHDGQGGGRQPLYPDTKIKLSNDTQCSCICYQDQHGEVTILLFGIEDCRPWIHLLTKSDLRQFVDTWPRQCRNRTDHIPALLTSPLTSEPSNNDAEPVSVITSSPISTQSGLRSYTDPISPSLFPTSPSSVRPSNTNLRRRTTINPGWLRETRTGCLVCAIIQHYGINIRDIKDSRADLLTNEIAPDKQIEVDVRKGQSHELDVEYVITITADF